MYPINAKSVIKNITPRSTMEKLQLQSSTEITVINNISIKNDVSKQLALIKPYVN